MARRRSTATVQQVISETRDSDGDRGEEAPAGQPTPAPVVRRELPEVKSEVSGELETRMIFVYGPPKIGKSTLASEFEDYFFFECEPGLKDLSVYKTDPPITSWLEFLEWAAAVAADPKKYKGTVIDTIDSLALYCSGYTNQRLGLVHESDAEWGKGWDAARKELQRALSKLANLGIGLIVIGHSKDIEVKRRNETYTRTVPRVGKAAREIVSDMADLILLCDTEYDDDGNEYRVIRTKPSKNWEAGERGNPPRLPETVEWPLGSGYTKLKEAWDA